MRPPLARQYDFVRLFLRFRCLERFGNVNGEPCIATAQRRIACGDKPASENSLLASAYRELRSRHRLKPRQSARELSGRRGRGYDEVEVSRERNRNFPFQSKAASSGEAPARLRAPTSDYELVGCQFEPGLRARTRIENSRPNSRTCREQHWPQLLTAILCV